MGEPYVNDRVIDVTPAMIRQMFNQSDLPERIAAGLLEAMSLRNEHVQYPAAKDEPFCTHSQMIRYSDESGWLVELFQYVRPDGKLGASGLPDPKRLRMGGQVYRAKA